ncbi:Inner membrane protein YbiR [Rubripirellula amarantea]|uniref:Inner membrane protein YbiR n=1 Tax=Rubripirellula amarantea TaxID=2527999 RepID=A0A5C5WXC7_9BACT|nr:SLC13 family permease [Rubripirellula amarantea]TWT54919.1 Inner membrane protein YbiR [Rubripirellula amarantea]
MNYEAWLTLSVVGVLLLALLKNLAPTDVLFVAATTILAVAGIISPEEAFAGFSNSGVLTVAFLFVVVAGLRETGVLDHVGHHVLGKAKSRGQAFFRLSVAVMPMSALLNNTPIVAMFVPIVMDWCRRNQVSPSKLLIPLSYLTILGGTCTVIGTSTNLVVNGLMIENGLPGMGMLELGKIGVPYAIVGALYLFFLGGKLLPDRAELLEQLGEARRDYVIEMSVESNCRLVGKTVEDAGLRQLPGLFLIEIERNSEAITPVRPEDRIESGDQLIFAGVVSGIIELEKIAGLVPVAESSVELSVSERRNRRMCEVVVSQNSSLNGMTIRDAEFRSRFGAVVLAVHRFERRLEGKLGDIQLQPGDTLLMQTQPDFVQAHRHDPAFYLVSMVDQWRPVRRDRAWIALTVFMILIVLMVTNWIPISIATGLAAVMMVALRCLSSDGARQSIEWQLLITIAASFGVGVALQNSGAASGIANVIVENTQTLGPLAALVMLYCSASILTEVITNNAAAVLLFPFCLELAKLYCVDARPFLIALTLAASASFMTPIGYQTNMMVYGPGGYRFADFLRIGAPLNVVLGIVAVILVPWFWPF